MPNKLHFYTKYSKEKIKITAKPFASGGEGAIYSIVSPRIYKHLVAKMYYPEKRTPERVQKMEYLINNPPMKSYDDDEHPSIGWVQDLIYKDQQFVGILLVRIDGKKLTKLTSSKLPRRADKAWKRFAFGQAEALKLRLRACFDLAVIIQQIHENERYVLVDLKPDNVLMQPNGLIAVVDMDSVEVIENGKAIFSAPVATPEYTPPEYYQDKKLEPIEETWDRFSLGIIFYQLLFGLHPFAASCLPPYDNLVGLNDKIQHGLYVHHPDKKHLFKVIPPPHQRFYDAPSTLQDFFQDCFANGNQDPNLRPSAMDWCIMLSELLKIPFDKKPILDILPSPLYFLPTEFLKTRKTDYTLPYLKKRFPVSVQIKNYKETPSIKSRIIGLLKREYQNHINHYRISLGTSIFIGIALLLVLKFWIPLSIFIGTLLLLLGIITIYLLNNNVSNILRNKIDTFVPEALEIDTSFPSIQNLIQEKIQSLQQQNQAIKQLLDHGTNADLIGNFLNNRRKLNAQIRTFKTWILTTEVELKETRQLELANYEKAISTFQEHLQNSPHYKDYSHRSYHDLKSKIQQSIKKQSIVKVDEEKIYAAVSDKHTQALLKLQNNEDKRLEKLQTEKEEATKKHQQKLARLQHKETKRVDKLYTQKNDLIKAYTQALSSLKKKHKQLLNQSTEKRKRIEKKASNQLQKKFSQNQKPLEKMQHQLLTEKTLIPKLIKRSQQYIKKKYHALESFHQRKNKINAKYKPLLIKTKAPLDLLLDQEQDIQIDLLSFPIKEWQLNFAPKQINEQFKSLHQSILSKTSSLIFSTDSVLDLLSTPIPLANHFNEQDISNYELEDLANDMEYLYSNIELAMNRLVLNVQQLMKNTLNFHKEEQFVEWLEQVEEHIHVIVFNAQKYTHAQKQFYSNPVVAQIKNSPYGRLLEKQYKEIQRAEQRYKQQIKKSNRAYHKMVENYKTITQDYKIKMEEDLVEDEIFEFKNAQQQQLLAKTFLLKIHKKRLHIIPKLIEQHQKKYALNFDSLNMEIPKEKALKDYYQEQLKKQDLKHKQLQEDQLSLEQKFILSHEKQLKAIQAERNALQEHTLQQTEIINNDYQEQLKDFKDKASEIRKEVTKEREQLNRNYQEEKTIATNKIIQEKKAIEAKVALHEQHLALLESDHHQLKQDIEQILQKAETIYTAKERLARRQAIRIELSIIDIKKEYQEVNQFIEQQYNTQEEARLELITTKKEMYQTSLNQLKQLQEEKIRIETLTQFQEDYDAKIYIKDLLLNRVEQFEKKKKK